MRTYHDCVPCFIGQALDAARRVTDEPAVHEQLLRETLLVASRMTFDQPPPAMGEIIHRRLRELTGQRDPYRLAKEHANSFALRLYPDLRQMMSCSEDPLNLAVRLAIAGNIIDLGVKSRLTTDDIKAAIREAIENTLDGDAVEELRQAIDAAEDILYLADNAGEIVFDRLLIEQLPLRKVTLAVKGGPIINDATREDAETVGLTTMVQVIDSGAQVPGTILEQCSDLFRQRFERADLIIAKGQGNYETLSETPGNLFFLLKVKCPVLARDLNCELGRMMIRRAGTLS